MCFSVHTTCNILITLVQYFQNLDKIFEIHSPVLIFSYSWTHNRPVSMVLCKYLSRTFWSCSSFGHTNDAVLLIYNFNCYSSLTCFMFHAFFYYNLKFHSTFSYSIFDLSGRWGLSTALLTGISVPNSSLRHTNWDICGIHLHGPFL